MPRKQVIYSSKSYEKDVKAIQDAESGKKPLDLSAFKRLMVHDLCSNTNILNSMKIGAYSIEKIQDALQNPRSHSSILLETSRYLMNVSPFYMRINNYFSKMGLFNYVIDVYDLKVDELNTEEKQKKLRDTYFAVCSEFEKINLKHEMLKIMETIVPEDVFYGLVFEDSTDFFILKLNPVICEIRQIQDGVYNYRIRLNGISPLEIGTYPDNIKQAYLDYHHGEKYHDGWYIPPADQQVCFKFNTSLLTPMPFMMALTKDILDLDVYKKLKLQKARVDNYKAIVVEIPIDEDAVDKPLLTEDTLTVFAEMNKANMPEDVGLLHVPGNAEAVSFKDNTNSTNNLSDAVTNLYDNAGVPHELFNAGSAGTAFKLSLENDASFIYAFYRQCERFFNRFIKMRKYNKPLYKFAVRIQDSTVFNRYETADAYLKAAQNGLPFKLDYAASLGKSQSRLIGDAILEVDILHLQDYFIPLSTSYTQSGDGSDGRPTNESKGLDLSDEGEKSANKEKDLNR